MLSSPNTDQTFKDLTLNDTFSLIAQREQAEREQDWEREQREKREALEAAQRELEEVNNESILLSDVHLILYVGLSTL
jgi:hypothetical protein